MASPTVQQAPAGILPGAIRQPEFGRTLPGAPRYNVSRKVEAFAEAYVKQGCVDARSAAIAAGYTRPDIGRRLALKYAKFIDEVRVRVGQAHQMEMDEALRTTAALARAADDERVQLGALQTILRVHGALADKAMPPADRRNLAGQLERLLAEIKDAAGPGAKRARALLESESSSGRKVRIGVEVSEPADDSGMLPAAPVVDETTDPTDA